MTRKTSRDLKPNDPCLLDDGRRALFVAPAGDVFVVRPLLAEEGDEDEGRSIADSPIVVSAVHHPDDVPGVFDARAEAAEARVRAAEERLASLCAEIDARNNERRASEREYAATMESLKRYDVLRDLDRMLTGELQWVLEIDYLRVKPLSDYLEGQHYRASVRMFAVHVDRDRRPLLNVAAYADGSGHLTTVRLFATEQEAQVAAQRHFNEILPAPGVTDLPWPVNSIARSAVAGEQPYLSVPKWLRARVLAELVKRHQEMTERYRRQFDEQRDLLAKHEAKLKAALDVEDALGAVEDAAR